MNKQEIQQRVSQFGKPLPLDKFEWDEETNTFSTKEHNLVLDFKGIDSCTFKTGSSCTFDTGSSCTFDTEHSCTFKTGSSCTFKTGKECVVVRRDVYEVIELVAGQKIKLNARNAKGFTIVTDTHIETIEIGGIKYSKKEVEEKLKGIVAIK